MFVIDYKDGCVIVGGFKQLKKRTIHIVLLALFHLMVFTIPFFVKVYHHHTPINVHNNSSINLSQADKNCYICQFEFVTFIAKAQVNSSIIQQTTAVNFPFTCQSGFRAILAFYSLRAPPLS
jgi:hypothetical protein